MKRRSSLTFYGLQQENSLFAALQSMAPVQNSQKGFQINARSSTISLN